VVITHRIYLTVHGVVQGWTTADGGKPVAVVNQRSTYNHEVDSGIGFLRWNTPSLTTSAQTWMIGAEDIGYTFNWFYVDDKDTAYYVSGLDPIRPSDVDPNLPTWGTGIAEWQGYLSAAGHPHEIDPARGFFTSWNNKAAPLFSAADDNYGYGPIYRNMSLNAAIEHQFALHDGKITRADLVQAMETAATVDLTGAQVVPELLRFLSGHSEPPGVTAMLAALKSWLADGAHRRKSAPGDAQYADADAVAAMDQLEPTLIRAIFDPIFAAGGVYTNQGLPYGYDVFPMSFANTPDNEGANVGSSYDGGWEGYVVKVLRQLNAEHVGAPFPAAVSARLCGPDGLSSCFSAIDAALATTYAALTAVNGTSDVSAWTQSTASKNAGETMPEFDAIHFTSVGIIGQPAMDWQNRPTFQQVVEFPAHRGQASMDSAVTAPVPLPGADPWPAATGAGLGAAMLVLLSRRRGPTRRYRPPRALARMPR